MSPRAHPDGSHFARTPEAVTGADRHPMARRPSNAKARTDDQRARSGDRPRSRLPRCCQARETPCRSVRAQPRARSSPLPFDLAPIPERIPDHVRGRSADNGEHGAPVARKRAAARRLSARAAAPADLHSAHDPGCAFAGPYPPKQEHGPWPDLEGRARAEPPHTLMTDSVVSHEAKHGSGRLQERFLDRSQGKLRAHQDTSATSVAAAMAGPPGSDRLPVAPHKAAPAGLVADASPRPGRIQGAQPWCGQCSGSSESRPIARHFLTRGDDGREQSGQTSDSPVARRVKNRPNFFPPRFFSAISQPELGDYVARSNPNEGSLVRPPWSQCTITLVRWPGRPGGDALVTADSQAVRFSDVRTTTMVDDIRPGMEPAGARFGGAADGVPLPVIRWRRGWRGHGFVMARHGSSI